LEIAALIISIVAVIISIAVGYIQHKREYNINQTNLEAVYFNDIYKEYLIKRIPIARRYIRFDKNGVLKDTNKIIKELNNIRQDSIYYLYNDEKFYNELKKKCQDLEDYLVRNSTNYLLGEEQTEFHNKLQNELKAIYRIINDKFLGKK
jgi:hypothetical protein